MNDEIALLDGIKPRSSYATVRHISERRQTMRIRLEDQLNPVADDVLVVQPILLGVLFSLKQDIVSEVGAYANISLKMLARLRRPGDGDCGICFEYAVHDAMNRGDGQVLDRIESALKICKVRGAETKSILFGAEKNGTLNIIETARDILTDDSRLLTGIQAQPIRLRRYLDKIVHAFKNRQTKNGLPFSISGLWKADLFVGHTDSERWVATTVKNNAANLEGAQGLRIGIVPARTGIRILDRVRLDDTKNLVICPLLYDGDFMQKFYEGWQIVQAFLAADAQVPHPVMLPRPAHRQVAEMLNDRRDFSVLDIVAAIRPFAQPELLSTAEHEVGVETLSGETTTDLIVAPRARRLLV
jgi:hypothetical protein